MNHTYINTYRKNVDKKAYLSKRQKPAKPLKIREKQKSFTIINILKISLTLCENLYNIKLQKN